MKIILLSAFFTLSSFVANAEDINLRIHSAPQADTSIYRNIKPFGEMMAERQQQNFENQMQVERLRIQQQQLQMQQQNAMQNNHMQSFLNAADNIDVTCQEKRRSGVYKSYSATNQKCTSPQVMRLAEQMNIPNIGLIKKIMTYSESLAKRIDLGEISEQEAFNLLNSYNPSY